MVTQIREAVATTDAEPAGAGEHPEGDATDVSFGEPTPDQEAERAADEAEDAADEAEDAALESERQEDGELPEPPETPARHLTPWEQTYLDRYKSPGKAMADWLADSLRSRVERIPPGSELEAPAPAGARTEPLALVQPSDDEDETACSHLMGGLPACRECHPVAQQDDDLLPDEAAS